MQKWAKSKIKEMSQEYKYNFFLRIALETYLEGTLISLLNIRHYKVSNVYQIVSLAASIIILSIYILFTVWTFFYSFKLYKQFKGQERIEIDTVRSMFGEYKMKNFGHAMFNSLFLFRRLTYTSVIVFLSEYPLIQIFIFTLTCIPVFALHVVNKPYWSTVNNVLMIINETVFIVLGCAFFIFSEDCITSTCEMVGNSIIGIVVTIVTLNLATLWVLKFIDIVGQIKQYLQARNGIKKEKTPVITFNR